MMKRRDALKAIGGLGTAAGMARFLPACGSDGPTGITTYVYMMMENRSYDHYFGARSMLEGKPGDGLKATMTNPDMNGQPVAPFTPTKDQLCVQDPEHGWDKGREQFNGGANDGFVRVQQAKYGAGAIEPMQYMTRTDLPVSWALADHYATADRWFCSVMGSTWPNRFYWHSASSGGLISNTLPPGGLSWPSIYQRLDAKGVSWGYYYGSIPVVPLFADVDANNIENNLHHFSDFLDDAKAGRLPSVVYIDPVFAQNDDHPSVHPIHGQQLISTVYTALARSPQWKNCMLVITYDEHGGFFDHVPPPTTVDERAAQGFNQLGFRVPALVAGPYVKQGYVSSVIYEHCSALRELEVAFGLEPVNQRSAASNDLSDFLDAGRLAKGDWAKPIELPAVNPDDATQWPMNDLCSHAMLREDHPIVAWADAHADALGSLDLRSALPEYHRAIQQFWAERPVAPVK